MRGALAAAAALAIVAAPAMAQRIAPATSQSVTPAGRLPTLDLSVTQVDPGYLWFDAPNTTDAGDARMRIVFAGREGAAALTPNQYWFYSQSYRRHLARLAMGRSVASAEPHARYSAFRDVAARYPNLRVQGFDLKRSYGAALITPDL